MPIKQNSATSSKAAIQNGSNQPSREGSGPTPRRPKIGEQFNPWRDVCGFYPADIVARQHDLSDGQKRLYERGVRWAGKNGVFWYAFPAMSEALGKSVRQVKDDMATLEAKGLIGHTRRRRQSNLYHFLWHAIFEVQSGAHQERVPKVQNSPLEVQDSVKNGPLKVQPTARESCPSLKFVKEESSSEAAEVPSEAQPVEANDDDPLFCKEEKNQDPAAETARAATSNLEDRDVLIETAREQLRMARAAGLSRSTGMISPEILATTKAPDRAITVQILEAFSDYDDFTTWLESTISRGSGAKGKILHMGPVPGRRAQSGRRPEVQAGSRREAAD